MKHFKDASANTIELSDDLIISQNVSGQIDVYGLGEYGHTVTQTEMRELLPCLQLFAETGVLPPPESEKTPIELLLERVNAVPRPWMADGRSWCIVGGGLHLGSSGNIAHVMMDRGGATSVAAIASTADARQLIDYVDAVANIVREHYDREANGSTNR